MTLKQRGRLPAQVLTTLACIGLAADGVHGHGQGGVGFQGDGAIRHGTRHKPLHYLLGRLNLQPGQKKGIYANESLQANKASVNRGLLMGLFGVWEHMHAF